MFVKQYGSGSEVYVGLHGWSGDHTTFAPLVPHLPERASLYCPDLPGCGASPAPRAWTLAAVGEKVGRTVKKIGADEITVIGSCSGGLYGLVAARLDDEVRRRIRRFVLIDPYAYFPWYFRVFIDDRLGGIGWYAYCTTFANPIGRWIANLSLSRHRTDDSHLTRSFRSVNHAVAYRYLKLLADIPGVEWFRDFCQPVDILCGEKTFAAARESARRWQSVWPQARCHELKGAGHLPVEEAAEQLSEIVFESGKEQPRRHTNLHQPDQSRLADCHS